MSLSHDIRYALRTMRRNPGFTAAILALALGIGANTAIFTVLNTLLLRTLPFEDAGQLVLVFENSRNLNRPRNVISAANYLDWRTRNRGNHLLRSRRPRPAPGHQPVTQVSAVDPDFFSEMRVRLSKGRLFERRDNVMKGPRIYIVNEAFVRATFPNEEALGKRIIVAMGDDIPGEIVGVVADIRHTGLSEDVRPTVYYSYAHLPIGMVHFLVRTRLSGSRRDDRSSRGRSQTGSWRGSSAGDGLRGVRRADSFYHCSAGDRCSDRYDLGDRGASVYGSGGGMDSGAPGIARRSYGGAPVRMICARLRCRIRIEDVNGNLPGLVMEV